MSGNYNPLQMPILVKLVGAIEKTFVIIHVKQKHATLFLKITIAPNVEYIIME